MQSTSAPILRNRVPLSTLPLSLFVHPSNIFPSPVSLPLKRNAPSASGSVSSTSGKGMDSPDRVKVRKVSIGDDGGETIKRSRVKEVTPKAKSILESDELGTGRSPARRLFVDAGEGTSSSMGIIGAIPSVPSPPSIPNRALAPSPPISETASPVILPVNDNLDIHDVGFAIFSDSTSRPPQLNIGIGTPDSRRNRPPSNPPLALDAETHIPSSPSSSVGWYDENQENIPPPLSPSRSYSTTSSPGSSRHKRHLDDDEVYGSGSRHRRMERSKLGLESVIGHGPEEDDDGEELTPGRVVRKDVLRAKARLTREVDRI